jgi:predicted dehydrogenase
MKGVDDALAGIMRFPSLELGLFDCDFRSSYRQTVEVVGDQGTLELPAPFLPGESRAVILRHGDKTGRIGCEGANHYQLMVEHFSDCVLNDHEPLYPPTDGLHNMRIIDMLYESARDLAEKC